MVVVLFNPRIIIQLEFQLTYYDAAVYYINHCAMGTHLYQLYVFGFGLVWFYAMSTIIGYLMPNHVYIYIYIYQIYDLYTHIVNTHSQTIKQFYF